MKKFGVMFLGFTLTFSSILLLPEGKEAAAATKKLDKVNFGSSISRTFDDEGLDYFYLNLKKDQTININLKDTKDEETALMVVSGVNVNSFKNYLAKIKDEDELEELFDDLEDVYDGIDDADDRDDLKDFKGIMKNLKIETILDADKDDDDDSIGQRKTDIGLKKGNYLVFAMSDDDDNSKYKLSITASKKKNVEIESNDSLSKAMPIKRSQVYQSSVFTYLDEADFYKVSVPEAGNLVVSSTTKKNAKMVYDFYDSKKKKLTKSVKKSGKTYTAQAAVKKGTYYIRVKSNMFDRDDLILNYNLKAYVKTKTPSATVVNKKGTSSDSITVKGLQKGAKVIVYKDAKKKTVLATRTATASTMKINTKKLTDRGGKIYITVKNKGLYTSSLKSVSYKAVK